MPTCTKIITDANAQALFVRLNVAAAADGCTLETFDTVTSSIRVVWKTGGRELSPITLTPAECAVPGAVVRGEWAIAIPADVSKSCPNAAARTFDAIGVGAPSLQDSAPTSHSSPRSRAKETILAASVLVVVILVVVSSRVYALRKKKRGSA